LQEICIGSVYLPDAELGHQDRRSNVKEEIARRVRQCFKHPLEESPMPFLRREHEKTPAVEEGREKTQCLLPGQR